MNEVDLREKKTPAPIKGEVIFLFYFFPSWPVSHTRFCWVFDELRPSIRSPLPLLWRSSSHLYLLQYLLRCEFSMLVYTNQRSFELAERNCGVLKSLFDGEPNLFLPLKSLFELSEMLPDVAGEGAVLRTPLLFLCGFGFPYLFNIKWE